MGQKKERMCLITRQVQPAEGMLRFVAAPDGNLVVDLKGNLPGRGMWVTSERSSVCMAREKNKFLKAAEGNLTVSPTLENDVADLMMQRALQALSLARKAGQTVCGLGKVEEALAKNKVIGLLHADDGAEDGLRKLKQFRNRARKARSEGDKQDELVVPIFRLFRAEQLGLAFGRPDVIHAALLLGSAADAVFLHLVSYNRYRQS